ncbi:MAG: hypothetical protein GY696_00140 [Gammaproteobacteria bacterium]|nr:hypothetical protein [Gammaproteobacteria bacterium]
MNDLWDPQSKNIWAFAILTFAGSLELHSLVVDVSNIELFTLDSDVFPTFTDPVFVFPLDSRFSCSFSPPFLLPWFSGRKETPYPLALALAFSNGVFLEEGA